MLTKIELRDVELHPDGARHRPIILRYAETAASSGSLSALPLTCTERKRFFVREGLNLGRIGRYLEAGFVERFINLRYLKTTKARETFQRENIR